MQRAPTRLPQCLPQIQAYDGILRRLLAFSAIIPVPAKDIIQLRKKPKTAEIPLLSALIEKYTREDSNLQPPVPKTGALSN
jgi:hypothetical protein